MTKLFNYDDEMLIKIDGISLPKILMKHLQEEAKRLNINFDEVLLLYLDKGVNVVDLKDFKNFDLDKRIKELRN